MKPIQLHPIGRPVPARRISANDGDAGVVLVAGLLLAVLFWRRLPAK